MFPHFYIAADTDLLINHWMKVISLLELLLSVTRLTSHSLLTLPGFSASVSRSATAMSASVSAPSSASIFAASSALGSASSAPPSHILKTVGNNVRIENRECHLHHFEQSVLSIEQVEEFNDK